MSYITGRQSGGDWPQEEGRLLLDHSAGQGSTSTIDFPAEFRAWLDYLEYADPDAHQLFVREAGIDLT